MHAGDIVRVDFGTPIGSEAGFARPAVVVTADGVLEGGPRTLQVVPLTSNTERALMSEVVVEHNGAQSAAQAHLLTTISVQRVVDEPNEHIGPVALTQIRAIIADLIDAP